MHPQRGPRRPQQPIFDTFLRGGLHCEHYTTSSPDLTATQLGELHDMRVRHAASTPLGGFMECKTPTTGGVEGAGRTVHPAGAPASAKKLAQHRPYTGLSAKKFAQQAQKHQIWGVLSAQGELFRAFAITQRRRATNFAHSTQKHGDLETSNTTARPQQGTTETDSTIACLQHPENQHFPRAKATPVSSQRSHKVAKVSPVSSRRSSALDTAPMHQIAQQRTGN